MAERDQKKFIWLAAWIVVLTAVPRMRFLPLGPPIYVLDLVVLGAWAVILRRRGGRIGLASGMTALVVLLMGFALLAETVSLIYLGDTFASVYMAMRTMLAMSAFFLVQKLVQDIGSLRVFLQAATVGVGITAALVILASLPFTRSICLWIYQVPLLAPDAEGVTRRLGAAVDRGIRGRSLVGVSNLSGAFILITWPLVVLLSRWPMLAAKWRWAALGVAVLCPAAALLTYSRAALLGLVLAALTLTLFARRGGRLVVIGLTVLLLLTFTVVGWDSDVFFFDRIEQRTEIMLSGDLSDGRESERVLAYSQPFVFVTHKPMFLVTGQGLATHKVTRGGGERWRLAEINRLATHSAFAYSVYAYGMVAAFVAMALLLLAGFRLWGTAGCKTSKNDPMTWLPSYLLASYVGMLPWWLFDHGAVSQPRGAMMYYMFLGLVAVATGRRRTPAHVASPSLPRPV